MHVAYGTNEMYEVISSQPCQEGVKFQVAVVEQGDGSITSYTIMIWSLIVN